MISGYNTAPHPIRNMVQVVAKQLHIHGFLVNALQAKYAAEFFAAVPARVAAGALRHREHRVLGLERAGHALLDVMTGANFGKCVVVVAEE